jgi:uncharacterized cupin superfamily protein
VTSANVPIHTAGMDVELSPWALSAEALVAGDPAPRGHVVCRLESDGSQLVTGLYAAAPGALRVRVLSTETIYVLEGKASIELSDGPRVDLAVGDVAVIPAGHEVTWTFHTHFKEFFVLSA